MTELEIRINKLEETLQKRDKSLQDAYKEIKELNRELEREKGRSEQLLQSKHNSNNYLIEDNNRYARTYEDKYIQVIDRLNEIERLIKNKDKL